MAVAQHSEHSFDLDLLISAKSPVAIDVGCRGFSIARQLVPFGVKVHSLDIDGGVATYGDAVVSWARSFHHLAMLGTAEYDDLGDLKLVGVHHSSDPAATCVGKWKIAMPHAPATTIGRFLDGVARPPRVDLLKLDCEGSEYGIIEDIARAEKPLARQITVEYHDHCGKMPPGGPMWFDQIAKLLSRNYEIVKHRREIPPWGGQPSYVDCLYIAREW